MRRSCTVLAGLLSVVAVTTGAGTPGLRPNVVLVLTDDQDLELGSLDAMPNLEALVSGQGTSFGSFVVPLSLCCPARTTLLRGQYPHNHGVLTNTLPLGGFEKAYRTNLETATVATLLREAGYRTALLGKYLNGYPGPASPSYVPPGWDEWYSPAAGNPYSQYNYTLNENGALKVYRHAPADYLGDVILGKAQGFIERTAPTGTPFFICFASYAPHTPSTPAPRHSGTFEGVKAPRPPSFNEEDTSDKPAWLREVEPLSEAQVASLDEAYRKRLQSLQAVDEAIAALLATLEATGQLDNTFVFFTSDNGFHMGEHRLPGGKYTPYQTDIRVPLLVRGPGVPAGVVRDELTSSIDLLATFLDLAGVPLPSFADGRSLLPLLREAGQPPAAWRQALLLEQFGTGEPTDVDEASVADPGSELGVLEPGDPQDLVTPRARSRPMQAS